MPNMLGPTKTVNALVQSLHPARNPLLTAVVSCGPNTLHYKAVIEHSVRVECFVHRCKYFMQVFYWNFHFCTINTCT